MRSSDSMHACHCSMSGLATEPVISCGGNDMFALVALPSLVCSMGCIALPRSCLVATEEHASGGASRSFRGHAALSLRLDLRDLCLDFAFLGGELLGDALCGSASVVRRAVRTAAVSPSRRVNLVFAITDHLRSSSSSRCAALVLALVRDHSLLARVLEVSWVIVRNVMWMSCALVRGGDRRAVESGSSRQPLQALLGGCVQYASLLGELLFVGLSPRVPSPRFL